MTPQEYVQLKAFARQDGALLSLVMIGAFACYILGMSQPLLTFVALMTIAATPFFVASRLRHYRDYGRQGRLSFGLGYAYSILTFFYGGLLLTAATFIYFAYLDNGYLISQFTDILQSPESQQAMKFYGVDQEMNDSLRILSELRPIDYALNVLSSVILSGFFWGLPIALFMRKKQ